MKTMYHFLVFKLGIAFRMNDLKEITKNHLNLFRIPVMGMVAILFFLGINQSAIAQINYATAGANYTQNFDDLLGTVPANNTAIASVLPLGWSFVEAGTNANATFRVDNGSSGSGDTYFVGATSSNERALGSFASGSLTSQYGAVFTNTTGSTLTQFTLTYTGEQWKDGGSAAAILNKLTFSYAVNPTSLTVGTYVNVPNLDFTALINNTTSDAATNGNAANRRTTVTFTVEGLSWATGETLYIKWTDINDLGNDDNLAIDDLTFSALASTPAIVTTGTLAAITTIYGSVSATPTSFEVSGTSISGGIVVTAPTGYLVSLTSGSGYAPSVTVPGIGTIASTIVYVALSNTATVLGSPYSGDIIVSSAGATEVTVATLPSTVTQKQITVAGIFANSKVFDGNTNATLGGTAVLSGVVNNDTVSLEGTPIATFASSAVGVGIVVSVSGYSISGIVAGNYTLIQPSLVADITNSPSPVITSSLTTSIIYGTLAPTYTITATENPTSYNATGLPNGLSINTATGEITGTPTAAPGTYTAIISAINGGGTGNATLEFTITPKNLTVSGALANNKVYDKTTTATISGSILEGIFGADVVTISNSGTFATETVANGVQVTSIQTLGGIDATKYTVTIPSGLTANITPKAVSITSATALNKVFDGTTTATLTGTLFGVISPDVVTLNLSGDFASSAIANGLAVTSTSTISGVDAFNYSLTQPIGLTANITDAILYINQFLGTAICPTQGNIPTMALNAIGTPITRSSVTCQSTGNVFNSTTLNVTANPSPTSYIEFSASASTGNVLNVSSLSFFRQASNSAPNQIEVRYSTDGFATSTVWNSAPISPTSGTFATWDFTDFTTPAAGTVTFRIYPYGTQRADLTTLTAVASTGTFRVDDVTIYGTVAPANTVVNLKLFIEGYYDVSGMRSVKNNQDTVSPLDEVEDITVELHNAFAPYETLFTTTATLKTDGTAVCTFTESISGDYFLVIKGNNLIETWTANFINVGASPVTYDFSTQANKAFGDNMIEVTSGVFALYSGDINQDDNVDGTDYSFWETDSNNFEFGVFSTDLNGDGNVDSADYSIWESNNNIFVSAIFPQ